MAVLSDMNTRRVYAIHGPSLTIGRRMDCDLQIQDPCASNRHAQISCTGGVYYLSDLGSSNGTQVNGKRITESVQLKAGDIIGLGGLSFEFVEPLSVSSKSRLTPR